ncbi:hypothetical protein ACU3L3_07050 [Priestia endophytica]
MNEYCLEVNENHYLKIGKKLGTGDLGLYTVIYVETHAKDYNKSPLNSSISNLRMVYKKESFFFRFKPWDERIAKTEEKMITQALNEIKSLTESCEDVIEIISRKVQV